jgi:hypothetical protein
MATQLELFTALVLNEVKQIGGNIHLMAAMLVAFT